MCHLHISLILASSYILCVAFFTFIFLSFSYQDLSHQFLFTLM